MSSQRRLLVICPRAFQLGSRGATSRLDDIATGLCAYGWGTTILRGWYRPSQAAREAQDSTRATVLEVPRGERGEPPWVARPLFMRLWKWWRIARYGAGARDPSNAWAAAAPAWYESHCAGGSPDAIWAVVTHVGSITGALAAQTLARHFSCPWVLEFQDPCPLPGSSLLRPEQAALDTCLASCTAVVTTTQGLADHLVAENPCCAGKTYPFHLSFDDSEMPPVNVRRCGAPLRLLHAGTLTGGAGRSAAALVSALQRGLEMEPTMRGQVVVDLLGGGAGVAEATQQARTLGMADVITARGEVPQAEALRAMDEADVLVVIKYPDPRYNLQIPGKTFQYMGRGKPILGIMGECEAAEVLRPSGLAEIFEHSDIEGLARQIVYYWRNRERLPELYKPNWEYIKQFSRSAMAKRLNALLTELVEGARAGS